VAVTSFAHPVSESYIYPSGNVITRPAVSYSPGVSYPQASILSYNQAPVLSYPIAIQQSPVKVEVEQYVSTHHSVFMKEQRSAHTTLKFSPH
jgi:hypothetical protein